MNDGGYWQKRLSRRRVLRGAALGGAGLAAAAVIGCGDEEEKPAATAAPGGTPAAPPTAAPARTPTPAAAQPKRGGTINHAGGPVGSFDSQAVGFDPYTYFSIAGIGYRLFYQGLLGYNPRTYAVGPELAQKWEQPSPTEYIFTLQPGVKWHNKPPANGRPLTVEDVVFSLERARTNDPRFFSRSVLISVDKIEAVDKSRVRITTKGPDATTLSKFSADLLLILAPEVVEKAGKFATADTAVGTGAFIVKSMEDRVGAEYVRNPDYWKPGLPYLDGLRTRHFADEPTAYAALQAGQLDITRVPGNEVKKYIAGQGAGYTPDWFFDNTYVWGQPNNKTKPLDDKRVRRALRLFIDHDEMIKAWGEVWFGRGSHSSIFPSALEAWDLKHEEYAKLIFWKQPKDEAAKEGLALLSAAGFNQSNPLKFEVVLPNTSFLVPFAQFYQAMWKKNSQGVVDANLRPIDIAQANGVRAKREFEYLIHGSVPGTVEPDAWLTEIFLTGASTNFMQFSDPKADELIGKQRTIFDLQQRKAAIKEIILYMIENGAGSVPANRYYINGLNRKIRSYAPEFYMNGAQYEQVWLDA